MTTVHQIQDLTNVETIYYIKIKTLKLKIRRDYIMLPHIELQTASTPFDVYQVLHVIFQTLDDDQEHLILLILNAAQEIRGYKVIASGSQDHVLVDTKVLFRNALLLGASGIILAHNHPSDQLEPSTHDLEVTKTVVEGGRTLDIDVFDHIIYTRNGYTSLRNVAPVLFADKE